jgi:hypothetical protein
MALRPFHTESCLRSPPGTSRETFLIPYPYPIFLDNLPHAIFEVPLVQYQIHVFDPIELLECLQGVKEQGDSLKGDELFFHPFSHPLAFSGGDDEGIGFHRASPAMASE